MYDVKILGLLAYYRYFFTHFSKPFKLTDSGYPAFFALGYCSHKEKEIVVCKVLNWRLRALHEVGHVAGMKHVYAHGHIMHPWGIFRGRAGQAEIARKLKGDYDHYLELIG